MNIGEKIKNLRIAQGLTQEELAQRCELTKGFISQVERDIASPSITSFIDILDALGTRASDFFDETEEKVVFKDEDFSEYNDEEKGYLLKWLVPNSQKNLMEPTIIEIEPKGRSEVVSPFEGEVFGYILEGKLDLKYGEEYFKLKKGENFYLRANKSHQLSNNGSKVLKLIWVSGPPNF